MKSKDILPNDDVIMLTNFKDIPASTIGVVKKITKTGLFIEWELPGNPVKHFKFNELQYIEKYMRLHAQPFGNEFPW